MPPKKRKATAAPAVAAPAKKVRIGDTSTIEDSTSASGRPRRSTTNDSPQYKVTRTNATSALKSSTSTSVPKKHGTASKHPLVDLTTKKKTSEENGGSGGRLSDLEEDSEEDEKDVIAVATPSSSKKKPERPKKANRPNSKKAEAPTRTEAKMPIVTKVSDTAASNTIKRGRKTQAKSQKTSEFVSHEVTRRGDVNTSTDRGGETSDSANAGDENVDENIQYWLMKAEPESRIEKGQDVKFSIDDLASRTDPEGWDGVRNPVARNNMRAMRQGDLAFFYHSNCKIPGIAGLMRIVEEHSIDESAFDPTHPYYDPKSVREKPKWELVKVEFVKKFDKYITLKELRSFAEKGGALEGMQMLRQSRLSVSSVQPKEWRFILDLMGESHALGHGAGVDGYESDTDGEAEDQKQKLARNGRDVKAADDGLTNGIVPSQETADSDV